MLSSDILEQQFGHTHIIVIQQNDQFRIIQTIAANSGEVLEVSLVRFDQSNINSFPDVHRQIIAGSSMGKAYKKASVPFVRNVISTTKSHLPPGLQSHFGVSGPATIIEVDIYVGTDKTHYCNILEVYSPKVTWPGTFNQKSETLQ
jgi:hypothetical protein